MDAVNPVLNIFCQGILVKKPLVAVSVENFSEAYKISPAKLIFNVFKYHVMFVAARSPKSWCWSSETKEPLTDVVWNTVAVRGPFITKDASAILPFTPCNAIPPQISVEIV